MLVNAGNQATELRWRGVADGVGNVDGGGTGGNRRFDHLVEKLGVTPPGVFTGEFNVFNQGAGIAHHLGHDREHVLAALAQFVLEMNVAGGNKGVDPAAGCWSHGIGTGLDIGLRGTGQSTNDRTVFTTHLLGNSLNGREVAGTRKRETGLDHIDAQAGQLLSDRQLLLKIETGAWRLFTIPKGGVKNQDATWVFGHDDAPSTVLVEVGMS